MVTVNISAAFCCPLQQTDVTVVSQFMDTIWVMIGEGNVQTFPYSEDITDLRIGLCCPGMSQGVKIFANWSDSMLMCDRTVACNLLVFCWFMLSCFPSPSGCRYMLVALLSLRSD